MCTEGRLETAADILRGCGVTENMRAGLVWVYFWHFVLMWGVGLNVLE